MRSRPLGRTGITVSEIGFGTWGLGGNVGGSIAYGPTEDAESIQALRHAFDKGVTFYDTADLYGFGHSERVLGEALANRRHQIVISTKVGLVDARGTQDFGQTHIRHALESSLKRLQTDYVDVLMLHNPPPDLLRADSEPIALVADLCRQGLCRTWGVSVRSPDDGLAAVRQAGCPIIQVNFNLVDQRARQNALLDLCGEQKVGCVIRTPLCFGFLTGQYAAQADFDPADHRRRWSVEQRQQWADASHAFRAAIAPGQAQTEAQIALRFCLAYASVSTVIPGMLTVAHITENLAASDLGPLSATERCRMEQIYENHTFFVTENRPAQHDVRE